MTDIAVIDYGMGNLHSVSTRLRQVAPTLEVTVTGDPAIVARAARVVFPGQGAMPDAFDHRPPRFRVSFLPLAGLGLRIPGPLVTRHHAAC